MTEQELKKIYFDFYDQLQEPYCSQAKENWDYKKASLFFSIPKNIELSILHGFFWGVTPQKYEYWGSIVKSIESYVKKDKDMVQNPEHYGGKDNPYEVIKVLEEWGLHKRAYLWNATKYIARAGKKDPQKEIEDLKKAIFYIEKEIKLLERQA